MKTPAIFFLSCLLLAGCVSTDSVISKSNIGNLEINLAGSGTQQYAQTELYLDGIFIGNLSSRLPVLHVKRGRHIMKLDKENVSNGLLGNT
jgi:hypothetical protein